MENNFDTDLNKLKEDMQDNEEIKEEKVEINSVDAFDEEAETKVEVKEETPKSKSKSKSSNKSEGKDDAETKPKRNRRGSANTESLKLEIEKQKAIADEAVDKYKRLLAEFENARNRNEKESTRMYDVGAKEVLEKLLPVVDNFERALMTIPEEDKDRAFEQGIDKIYKQMMVILEGMGVKPMNATGTEFNPDLHNAVMHVENDELGENVVAEEMQKGYMYKESVLRHSMVTVAN